MARFRSGTLEKSVKRWGRMPAFNRLKRKQFGWTYIQDDDNALIRTTDTNDFILFSHEDWDASTVSSSGVRNVSFDMRITITWTPESGAGFSFESWSWIWGIFCKDEEDIGTSFATFADTRALAWDEYALNMHRMNTGEATEPDYSRERRMTWRTKARQRYMQHDDQLRYLGRFNQDVSGHLADARIFFFGRISWEIP